MGQNLFVYFTPDCKNFQVIRPTADFLEPLQRPTATPEGIINSWRGLAEAITNSNLKQGIKNYHHYEVK